MPELTFPPHLNDGVTGLRPFQATDLPAFQEAAQPGENDGFWLTLDSAGPQSSLNNYLAGQPNPNDPVDLTLAIVTTPNDLVVGAATFIIRAEDSVELVYGTAPAMRGQGVATRAATLASNWLLHRGGWGRVELRIDDNNHTSQRVAARAGFHYGGRVRTWVPSAGREFEDQLYLLRSGRSRCARGTLGTWSGW